MNTTKESGNIVLQLDALHARASQAFSNRDLQAYRDCFADDLQYTQLNGETINREQLMEDVKPQLKKCKSVETEFIRQSIKLNHDGTVTQILKQIGTFSTTVLIFLPRKWDVVRQGRYTYRSTNDGWKICEVKVLEESVSRATSS